MIDKSNLERKEFSMDLPDLIAKIEAVGISLEEVSIRDEPLKERDNFLYGSGLILGEAVQDLKQIDKALHLSD